MRMILPFSLGAKFRALVVAVVCLMTGAAGVRASGPVNLWPFYLGYGDTHYVAWPFVKVAPKEFAFHPLYWYDEGVHRVAYLFSADPEHQEYALYPFFFIGSNYTYTPLGGYSRDAGANMWYSLTFGNYSSARAGENWHFSWFFPFYFSYCDRQDESLLWTPLALYATEPKRVILPDKQEVHLQERLYSIGPLGLPWIYSSREHSDTQSEHSLGVFPLFHWKHADYMHRDAAADWTPFAPATRAFSLGAGLLYDYQREYSLAAERPLPPELADLRKYAQVDAWSHKALCGLVGVRDYANKSDERHSEWIFPFYFRGHETRSLAGKTEAKPTRTDWFHLSPLWFSWSVDGETAYDSRLLVPLFYSRIYHGSDESLWLTPLAGAGTEPARQAAWWYALTAGGYSALRTPSEVDLRWLPSYETDSAGRWLHPTPPVRESAHWLLPLYFHKASSDGTSKTETLLTSFERTQDSLRFEISLLFPFYTHLRSLAKELDGGLLLFRHTNHWRTTSVRNGTPERTTEAPACTSFSLGAGLLYDWMSQPAEAPVSPVDVSHWNRRFDILDLLTSRLPKPRYSLRLEGYHLGIAGGLFSRSNFVAPPFSARGVSSSHTRLGWLLWYSKEQHYERAREVELFTPLYSYWRLDDKRLLDPFSEQCHGVLLNTITWKYTVGDTRDDFAFRLLGGLGAEYETIGRSRDFSLLGGLLADFERSYVNDEAEMAREARRRRFSEGNRGVLQALDWRCQMNRVEQLRNDDSLLLGVLYRHEDLDRTVRAATHKREEGKRAGESVLNENLWRTHTLSDKTSLLWGLLYHSSDVREQRWRWKLGEEEPEAPIVYTHNTAFSLLTPLIYSAESKDDGDEAKAAYERNLLLGLLYHEKGANRSQGADERSILGFLYRSRRYGSTRARTLFPFISVTTDEASDDWSFSFVHKLFRIERTHGKTKWWLFWF